MQNTVGVVAVVATPQLNGHCCHGSPERAGATGWHCAPAWHPEGTGRLQTRRACRFPGGGHNGSRLGGQGRPLGGAAGVDSIAVTGGQRRAVGMLSVGPDGGKQVAVAVAVAVAVGSGCQAVQCVVVCVCVHVHVCGRGRGLRDNTQHRRRTYNGSR